MAAGITREFGIQPQQKVHAAERFRSFQIPKGPKTRQIKVVLDDERAKSSVNFLPKGLKPRHFTSNASFNLNRGLQWFGELRHIMPSSVDIDDIGPEVPE